MRSTIPSATRGLAVATAISAISFSALADGGYYGGALGARAAGRSGAFVARADDLTAVAYNPAGLTHLAGPLTLMVGNRFSYNGYSYRRAPTQDWGNTPSGMTPPTVAFDEVSNSQPWQVLEPIVGVATNFGLPDWAFALAFFPEPGASRFAFPESGGQRYMMVGREAVIVDVAASAAWKHADWLGVGATLKWISVPRLDYSLVIDGSPFAQAAHPVSSPYDILAETKGADWFTLNAILGAWVRPRPSFEIGVAAQVIPSTIQTKSTLAVTPLNASIGTVDLTRGGRRADDVNISLPLPLSAQVGARYRHLDGAREVFDVELDVDYETWSRVNQFTVETNHLIATVQGTDVDLGRIAIAKQWRDTVAVKVGGDYAILPERLTLRAGAFYETAVADNAYANVDFPGGAMVGGSVGGSITFARRWEVAVAYQLRHQLPVSIEEANARVYEQVPASGCEPPYTDVSRCNAHYLGQPAPAVNAGTYQATSHFLAVALTYRFDALPP